jgi:hypothetical protein
VNEALRWTLIVGCLLLAILEAPQSAGVLVQDLGGPWRADPDSAGAPLASGGERAPADAAPTNPNRALKPLGAFASVAPEEVLAPDCCPPDRLPRELVPGRFAFLLAR